MDIVARSKYLSSDIAVALDVSGREYLVVAAKATWSIPKVGGRPRPLSPLPLEHADCYYGEPGLSALRYGSDFARVKPQCDVLFDAQAHSPTGRPITELTVGWQVGSLRKALKVWGPRTWRRTMGIASLSKPEPFTALPLHFGFAFGGARTYQSSRGGQTETLAECLLENPAGIGFAGPNTLSQIDGAPAPCLEALDEPIVSPDAKRRPVALSAIGRHWAPRKDYAGTYDETWRKNVFPFLPEDFDERFHQCAPSDQQMPYPIGGEPVVLRNMMAGCPDVRFQLPPLDTVTVRILRTDYSSETHKAMVDTLFFEPDLQRFSAVWRIATPIRRRLQEFDTIAIGPVDPAWWAAKVAGHDGGGCAGCGSPSDESLAESDA